MGTKLSSVPSLGSTNWAKEHIGCVWGTTPIAAEGPFSATVGPGPHSTDAGDGLTGETGDTGVGEGQL